MYRSRLLLAVALVTALSCGQAGGQKTPAGNADFPHTAIFRGRVVNEHDKPIKGVRVWPHVFHGKLAPAPPKATLAEAFADVTGVTDEEGTFSIPLHFAGDQLAVENIQVTARGYVQVMDGLKYRMLAGGEAVVDYHLQPGEVLAGTIDPLINGVVEAVFDPDEEFFESVHVRGKTFDQDFLSDIGGAFEVYVPPGMYTISAGKAELEGIQSGTTGIRIRRPSPAVSKSQCRAALEALQADMDRHYSYYVIKPHVDWNGLCDEYIAKVEHCETRDQFIFELLSMLRRLDDKHIWVEVDGERLPTSMRGWTPNWNEAVMARRLADARTIGTFAQIGSTRELGFGYLAVFDLAATPQETDELLRAMRRLREAPGFIVDLRRCSGGSEALAEQIAQFFCRHEVVYAKHKYRSGPPHDAFGPDLDRTLSPSNEPYTRPVVCLIGNRTMSSAESFAQMLDALPHAVTVGGRTRGSSGNPAPFALADLDLKVWYSRWFDMGPDGSAVEGQGVAPDIVIDEPSETYRELDPIFARSVAELRSRLDEFKVGVGKAIITPNPLIPISGGIGPGNPSTGKQGELHARAMVFQQGETKVAVVQLDLLGFPSVLCARVHKQVPRIPADNILIGSTHTHSAPDCYGFPGLNGKASGDLKYMDFVCNQAAIAVNQALDDLQTAHLKIATGEAKGKIAYNYYAPELYDPRMSVIQAITPAGKTIGTLVNYAVHPEVLGSRLGLVSPDLVGPLCEKLEADLGGMGMFMNGAQGGMITADNRHLDRPSDPLNAKWHDARTWEECLRIGHLMASEAQRIVKDAEPQTDPGLACHAREVNFPVASELMWTIILGSPLKYPHNEDKSISTRMNLVNIGNAQILTIPGEALPNIGYYLKRHMKGDNNLIFGLTNDAFGYILTKVDFNSFKRYEYVSRTSLGEMTGEILIENALDLIEDSTAPATQE